MCLRHLASKIRSLFMSNPNDFLLNTDYEMDKIVYFKSGDIMPTSGSVYIDSFDYGYIPLVFATFSFTEDFSDTRMSWTFTDTLTINLEAVSNGIKLTYRNTSNPNQKLYYRVYGFMPSDSKANTGNTQKSAKQFILNTDYNYCKLYKKGIATSDITITHDLGYTPLVLAWQEYPWSNPAPSVITPCWVSGYESDNLASISATNNAVTISGVPANNKVHYRIYYDEV